MRDRRRSQTRAYHFIIEQAQKVNQDLSRKPDKRLESINYISLDDLLRLNEGVIDPSPELVAALKKLLRPVVSEAEIDDYLVIPFLPRM